MVEGDQPGLQQAKVSRDFIDCRVVHDPEQIRWPNFPKVSYPNSALSPTQSALANQQHSSDRTRNGRAISVFRTDRADSPPDNVTFRKHIVSGIAIGKRISLHIAICEKKSLQREKMSKLRPPICSRPLLASPISSW